MINISWIRSHIYNFVVCKYNDNKQSESESESKLIKTVKCKLRRKPAIIKYVKQHKCI